MTTPTPAQIEAAAKAIFFAQNTIMHDHQLEWRKAEKKLWRELALAALTEVGESPTDKMMIEHLDGQIQTLIRENELLREDPDRTARALDPNRRGESPLNNQVVNATIERCAQVALDECHRRGLPIGNAWGIAAAIRALKG